MGNKEYNKAYYEANKEKLKNQQKAYREANKEKSKEYQKSYYMTVVKPKREAAKQQKEQKANLKIYSIRTSGLWR